MVSLIQMRTMFVKSSGIQERREIILQRDI